MMLRLFMEVFKVRNSFTALVSKIFHVAYAESKAANLFHIYHLSVIRPEIGFFSVHPGAVKTQLGRDFQDRHPWIASAVKTTLRPFLKSGFEGAQTSLYCALSPDCQQKIYSGCYFYDIKKQSAKFEKDEENLKKAKALWELSAKITSSDLAK